MAGVGKLLKQAQKMQRKIESLQTELAERELEISSGGDAVKIKITASGEFLSIVLDPDLLKEERSLIEETVLQAVKEASTQAKAVHEEEMGKATEGMSLPGLM
ncbi:MAG: YbaB/EbfC family nucleoid-associated protein [Opitutales bacterium]|jgi:nucleoid-associated protein EbfC|nr:YbaB/EbfC family nucleoid-associated protein [Opitutales bacterium]MDG2254962.1 YbaB/EbfC family nucleoid-associated protein [Opitutaceae bacterium]MBT5169101.1 YbaB/EbfC family nucleoid-associated protein [Opitutales bacterium]MBT5815098.1 YbaB/EbfC family nucleoid-associated protein [Opitutales bacterium]MBT6379781.1 YbaB/EbfC family nucleoid-associated protein [Opitutales bacterium]